MSNKRIRSTEVAENMKKMVFTNGIDNSVVWKKFATDDLNKLAKANERLAKIRW